MKRVFLIVLDSCGVGYEPDAAEFGDVGANTLHTCSQSPKFAMPNLISMGLGNLDGVDYLPKTDRPQAALARLQELSRGKDTTIGHWEIAGIVSPEPLPTFPHGFPEEVLRPFREQTGRGVLCNLPYSGTEVIKDYGREHVQTGDLIVYTSADSVFQIAAHESVVPPEQLYDDCRIARKILTGKYGVGRVIARPFEGEWPYTRTSRRHDFSLEPPAQTLLDAFIRDVQAGHAGVDAMDADATQENSYVNALRIYYVPKTDPSRRYQRDSDTLYLSFTTHYTELLAELEVDGVFGPATQRAVLALQRQLGIDQSGAVGPVLWTRAAELASGL